MNWAAVVAKVIIPNRIQTNKSKIHQMLLVIELKRLITNYISDRVLVEEYHALYKIFRNQALIALNEIYQLDNAQYVKCKVIFSIVVVSTIYFKLDEFII